MKQVATGVCFGTTLIMFFAAGGGAALVCLVLTGLCLPAYKKFVDRL